MLPGRQQTYAISCKIAVCNKTATNAYMGNFLDRMQDKYPDNGVWTGKWNGTIIGSGYRFLAPNPYGPRYYSECWGFALTLAQEYYQTDIFTRYRNEGNFTYSPHVGDCVRINNNFHSIFITHVNRYTVTYVDCNKDGDDKVIWDQTMTIDQLLQKFTHVERPIKVGDANGDDKLDSQDVDLMRYFSVNSAEDPGCIYSYRNSAMDVNNDRVVDIRDMSTLKISVLNSLTGRFEYLCRKLN